MFLSINRSFQIILFLLLGIPFSGYAFVYDSTISGDTIPTIERLTMTDAEIAEKKCEIVSEYFEFKKYMTVISDRSEIPRIRNANEIALYRLLSPSFLGGRDNFIEEFKNGSNDFSYLSNSYEVFECPNFDFIKNTSPDGESVQTEVSNMNIITNGGDILTSRYSGSLYYRLNTLSSYDISGTSISNQTVGIEEKVKTMRMDYYMYKLDSLKYVLKIKNIIDNNDSGRPTKVKTIDGNIEITVWKKPDSSKFEPCCDQPAPPDSDGDGFNDLVDCEPNNNSIYPGALEIIGDGIDQDCDGIDQLGEDKDGDGYFTSACKSLDPEIRKKCDCNDNDDRVFYSDTTDFNSPDEWLVEYNGWNDDNCDCVKDQEPTFEWTPLNFNDYIIVGKGHLKRGRTITSRYTSAGIYSSVFYSSSIISVVTGIQSWSNYKKHKMADTFRKSDELYRKSNNQFKVFSISGSVSLLTFAAQYLHLSSKEKKQKKFNKSIFENEKNREVDSKDLCKWELSPINSSGVGIGFYVYLD